MVNKVISKKPEFNSGFFNYTGQFQRKLRFELSIYRRDDLEDNSSSYHSAYNLL